MVRKNSADFKLAGNFGEAGSGRTLGEYVAGCAILFENQALLGPTEVDRRTVDCDCHGRGIERISAGYGSLLDVHHDGVVRVEFNGLLVEKVVPCANQSRAVERRVQNYLPVIASCRCGDDDDKDQDEKHAFHHGRDPPNVLVLPGPLFFQS